MAIKSGLAAQLGIKTESVVGTGVTVDRFYPLVSESVTAEYERLESAGIIAGRRLLTSEQWNGGNITIGGDIGLELYRQNMGLWWSHILGANNTTGSGPYTHTATIGDLSGKSFTTQIGKPGVGGTVHPFTYAGCKVASWELAVAQNEIATLGVTLAAMSVTTGTALASASYGTGDAQPFKFNHAAVSIAGSSYATKAITISGDNGLDLERRFLGSQAISEPLETARREITGSLDSEFIDLTAYNRVVSGTEAELILALTAGADTFTFTANVRFDGETPQVGGTEIVPQNLNFKVVADDTDAASLTAVTVNGDSAA